MQHLDSDSEKTLDENLDLENVEEKTSLWRMYSSTLLRLLVIALIFAALAWYMLDNIYSGNDNADIPVIKSDFSPIKIKPEDPGGMVVPNMDKDVYNNLVEGNNEKAPEHVLPMPEEPLNRDNILDKKDPMAPEEVKSEDSKSTEEPINQDGVIKENTPNITNNTSSETTNSNSSHTSNTSSTATTNTENPLPQEKISNQDLQQPQENKHVETDHRNIESAQTTDISHNDVSNNVAEPDIKPIPANQKNNLIHKNTRKIVNNTGYKIQLAAFRSQKEVEIEWKKIKTRYENILGKNTHSVEKKDLGAKGVFYRLQVGPLSSEAEARMLCQKLSSYKQNCFVVKK
ncbi:Sporulation related domain protein [Rickettsiales bacterium Ac37b]|nr:Sporulation related domain protein [Rickettsiales bacterium Ac37b]